MKEGNKEIIEESEINKEKTEIATNEEVDRGPYYVTFFKPVKFEGKEYDGVDLNEIRNLTTKDKIKIDRDYYQTENVTVNNPILTTMYAMCVAVHITKLPIEFFYALPNHEGIKVENKIRRGFFMPI